MQVKGLVIILVVLAAGSAAAAQLMPKYGVTVTAGKNVDFAKFHTYSWRRAQPSGVKAIDAEIVAAIDRELGALGLTKVSTGPTDVLVSYASLSRTDVDVKGKTDSNGLLPQYRVGTLVVVMRDPSSSRQLLQMRADLPIAAQPDGLAATINDAASRMFAEYPTRRRK